MLLPPPTLFLSRADLTLHKFTFTWSPIFPDCPAIHYNILASNCGSCPTTTNYTNVTCTDVPTDSSVCQFAIQNVFCESSAGNWSESISVNLLTSQLKENHGITSVLVHIAIQCLTQHHVQVQVPLQF